MVTKYDIFLTLAEKNKPLKIPGILSEFGKRRYEYSNMYRLSLDLINEKLIIKSRDGLQIKFSKKSRLLYNIIKYCVANNINYNYLLDDKLAKFIAKALVKVEFSQKDFKNDPKTFKKYVELLFKYGLIIKISNKPFKARLEWNSLINNFLEYFEISIPIKKLKEINFIEYINKEVKIFNKYIIKNEKSYNDLMNESEISFVHSSLSLEGNPITLPNTIKILKDKIIPKEQRDEDVKEIQNYDISIKEMLNDSMRGALLNKDKILNFHFLAMKHREDIAGKLRQVSVYIKGNPNFKIADWKKINNLLDNLLKEYNNFLSKKRSIKEIIEFSAYFHNQFQYIHPFIDGNSRITRLLTFHILRYFKIPVLDIPLGLLEEYLSYTKGYKKRDDKKLGKIFQLIVLYNLKIINERLKKR